MGSDVTDADGSNLPLLLMAEQCRQRVTNRGRPVRPMNLVQRDALEPKPAQALVEGDRRSSRTRVSPRSAAFVPGDAELCGYEYAVAARPQNSAEHALGMPEAVHVGRVEKGDPQLQCRADRVLAIAIVYGSVVVAIDRRTAVAHPRDELAGVSQADILH